MNILELLPKSNRRISGQHNGDPVIYSWHQQNNTCKTGESIAFRFTPDVLQKARYVEGDRCEAHINDSMTEVTFVIGSKGHKLSGSTGNKILSFKYQGMDALAEIFPKGNSIPLPLIETFAGKIICKLPTK